MSKAPIHKTQILLFFAIIQAVRGIGQNDLCRPSDHIVTNKGDDVDFTDKLNLPFCPDGFVCSRQHLQTRADWTELASATSTWRCYKECTIEDDEAQCDTVNTGNKCKVHEGDGHYPTDDPAGTDSALLCSPYPGAVPPADLLTPSPTYIIEGEQQDILCTPPQEVQDRLTFSLTAEQKQHGTCSENYVCSRHHYEFPKASWVEHRTADNEGTPWRCYKECLATDADTHNSCTDNKHLCKHQKADGVYGEHGGDDSEYLCLPSDGAVPPPDIPTSAPTRTPTNTPEPTKSPTTRPTANPTNTPEPTKSPTYILAGEQQDVLCTPPQEILDYHGLTLTEAQMNYGRCSDDYVCSRKFMHPLVEWEIHAQDGGPFRCKKKCTDAQRDKEGADGGCSEGYMCKEHSADSPQDGGNQPIDPNMCLPWTGSHHISSPDDITVKYQNELCTDGGNECAAGYVCSRTWNGSSKPTWVDLGENGAWRCKKTCTGPLNRHWSETGCPDLHICRENKDDAGDSDSDVYQCLPFWSPNPNLQWFVYAPPDLPDWTTPAPTTPPPTDAPTDAPPPTPPPTDPPTPPPTPHDMTPPDGYSFAYDGGNKCQSVDSGNVHISFSTTTTTMNACKVLCDPNNTCIGFQFEADRSYCWLLKKILGSSGIHDQRKCYRKGTPSPTTSPSARPTKDPTASPTASPSASPSTVASNCKGCKRQMSGQKDAASDPECNLDQCDLCPTA